MRKIYSILVLSLLFQPFVFAEGPAKTKVVLAVQPSALSSEMLKNSRPLEEQLEKQLGGIVDVEIYAPMSYAAVVEALRFGHADAALMGAWPAQLSIKLAGAELALAEVREVIHGGQKTEAPFYYSYWVVKKDGPFVKIEDLKGKNACFPSPVSSSGYAAPIGHLVERGILAKEEGKEADPKTFFGNVLFGGGYQQCWTALQSGQVDVAVIAGDVAEKLYREVLDNTRVLEEQGPIPSHALIFGSKLQEPLRSQLKQAFLSLSAPEYRELMRSFVSGIFTGFKEVAVEEHLGALAKYLELSGAQYTERLG